MAKCFGLDEFAVGDADVADAAGGFAADADAVEPNVRMFELPQGYRIVAMDGQ
jgi:hypothetical protein